MQAQRKRWLRNTAVGAAVVAAVPAGVFSGSALADTTASSAPTYTACLGSVGVLYNVRESPAPPKRCFGRDKQIEWSQIGPQGPQGAQGAQGAQGTQGPQGSQGPQGARGPQGSAGTGNVQVAPFHQFPAGQSYTIATSGSLSLVVQCGSSGGTLQLEASDTQTVAIFLTETVAPGGPSDTTGVIKNEQVSPGTPFVIITFTLPVRGNFDLFNTTSPPLETMDGQFLVSSSGGSCGAQGSAAIG